MTDLDKLEALAKAATQGEWAADHDGCLTKANNEWAFIPLASAFTEGAFYEDEKAHANAAFIAAANPATILDLIASARRDAELLSRVHQMATEGHVKAGCDNWRAVERCRQIAALTARAAHTGEG